MRYVRVRQGLNRPHADEKPRGGPEHLFRVLGGIATVAVIVCAFLAIPFLAAGADHPLLSLPVDKDRTEKLKQIEEALKGSDRENVQLLGALALHQWLHYPALFRALGDPKAILNAQAVREYQVARQVKPTGVLDAATLLRLLDDQELLQRFELAKALSLPGRAQPIWGEAVGGYEWVTVDGTWVITNESSANPLQTSKIDCYRREQRCDETTVIFGDNGSVSILKENYKVLAWEHDGVRAASASASCADYVMHIRRVEGRKSGDFIPGLATANRVLKRGGTDMFGRPCESSITSPLLSLRLDRGWEVQKRYREELFKALGISAEMTTRRKP